MTFIPVPPNRYDDLESDLELEGIEWATFTRRTNDPKLAWLQCRLDEAGIVNRRQGESHHAPILQVPAGQLDHAWAILDPVDDLDDDAPRFARGYAFDGEE